MHTKNNKIKLLNTISTLFFALLITTAQAQFSEQSCSVAFNKSVHVNALFDGNQEIGHAIWINRSVGQVKAKYFPGMDNNMSVHQRYKAWKPSNQVVLITSGAYSTSWAKTGVPVGLTFDHGKIVNENLRNDMDALCIVYATGGIAISNINEGNLSLEGGKTVLDLRRTRDLETFKNWAAKNKATCFQTHLLVHNNNLKIGGLTSSTSESIRKMLVIAKDSNGTLYNIIYYSENKNFTLFALSKKILEHLRRKNISVYSIINLETGGADILSSSLEVKDCRGKHLKAKYEVNQRYYPNVFAYYYEQEE